MLVAVDAGHLACCHNALLLKICTATEHAVEAHTATWASQVPTLTKSFISSNLTSSAARPCNAERAPVSKNDFSLIRGTMHSTRTSRAKLHIIQYFHVDTSWLLAVGWWLLLLWFGLLRLFGLCWLWVGCLVVCWLLGSVVVCLFVRSLRLLFVALVVVAVVVSVAVFCCVFVFLLWLLWFMLFVVFVVGCYSFLFSLCLLLACCWLVCSWLWVVECCFVVCCFVVCCFVVCCFVVCCFVVCCFVVCFFVVCWFVVGGEVVGWMLDGCRLVGWLCV